jgi:hypothetical protein
MSINEQSMKLAKLILASESLTSEIRSKALVLHDALKKGNKGKVKVRTFTLVGGTTVTLTESEYSEYVDMICGSACGPVETVKLIRNRYKGISLNDAAVLMRKIRDTVIPAGQ